MFRFEYNYNYFRYFFTYVIKMTMFMYKENMYIIYNMKYILSVSMTCTVYLRLHNIPGNGFDKSNQARYMATELRIVVPCNS